MSSLAPSALPGLGVAQSFDDLLVLRSMHLGHATVLRLYWAVLGREPELGGARYWLDVYDSGVWGPPQISQFFATSPEFQNTYGSSLSNAEFCPSGVSECAWPRGGAGWVRLLG